jgi:ketosteroid isomerase-like protein
MAMTHEHLANELLQLETQYWQALKNNDVDVMLRLTSDPCIVTGPQGVASIDRKTFREMSQNATWQVKEFRLADPKVQMIADDVAVLAYTVHEDMTVDGEPVTLDCADASTWVRRNGSWQCALHTEAILGDPFGRDKVTG